jgi:hypothetical protein
MLRGWKGTEERRRAEEEDNKIKGVPAVRGQGKIYQGSRTRTDPRKGRTFR